MSHARCSLGILMCGGLLLGASHRLAGQVPPPPPPPPPASATVVFAGGAAPMPAGRAPMGIPPEELPSFEVASVKKFEGRVTQMTSRTPGGGRLTIVNLPLRTILSMAWGGLRDYEMSGAPGWMTTDRFTISAKAETNAPREQLMLMLRALLVERFQLKYHVEKREMQAYVLRTADAEWTPTPRMRPVDCTAGRGAKPPAAGPVRPDQMPCGGFNLSTGGITARGVTMANFVSLVGSLGGLGVVHDRTGLAGTYHIELDASPTALMRSLSLASVMNPSSENLLPTVGDGRSLSDAVRDLGLRLERQREQVEVLIIDSVSQPDED